MMKKRKRGAYEKIQQIEKSTFSPGFQGLHALNPCRTQANFNDLAHKYKNTLGRYIKDGESIDWQNAEAVKCLTETLLDHDYGLQVQLHPERLSPKLPNRFNYLCWLHDLFEHIPNSERVHVLDVGTGANAIYPLLGSMQFGWRFTGTDIDEDSIIWASSHVINHEMVKEKVTLKLVLDSSAAQEIFDRRDPLHSLSGLLKSFLGSAGKKYEGSMMQSRGPFRQACAALGSPLSTLMERREELIQARLTLLGQEQVQNGSLQDLFAWTDEQGAGEAAMTACMTNPPFYDLEEAIKGGGHAACTGTRTEMRTVGGEVAFLAAMILDSLVLQRVGCRWYTCMVGKKSSIKSLRSLLREAAVPHVLSTRFTQGRTMRWGLAWSFHEDSPPQSVFTKKMTGRKVGETVALAGSVLRGTRQPSELGEDSDSLATIMQRVQLACDEIEKRHVSSDVHVSSTLDRGEKGEAGLSSLRISAGPEGTLLYIGRLRVQGTEEIRVEIELEQASDCPVALAQALSMQGVLATIKQHLQRSNRRWRREIARTSSRAVDEKKMENE